MSEPKRGKHYDYCIMTHPNCQCNSCQHDTDLLYCCIVRKCGICEAGCRDYLADEPTKKGAANV